MNKKHFSRCRLRYFALSLLLFSNLSGHSQSSIISGNQCSEFSIIRNYKDHVDITYNVMLDTITFNYVDRNAMLTNSVNILNNFRVWDFVVFHDSVFFCGDRGQVAIFGYFDIQDVLVNNTGSISYYELFYPTSFDPTASELLSLMKIDVTTSPLGKTHMLMTGVGYTRNVKNIEDDNRKNRLNYPTAIVEAWISSPSICDILYTIDTNLNYSYSDVAFTDNYAIVTASSTHSPYSHNFFYYNPPTLSGFGYLSSWITPPGPQGSSNTPLMTADVNALEGVGELLITRMENDTFATACINNLSGDIAISIYQDPIHQAIKRFEVPNTSLCREFIYNKLQKSFYFIDISSTQYLLYQTKSPFSSSMELNERFCRWLSLDNTDTEQKIILSGFDHSGYFFVYPKKYWLFDETDLNDTCFQKNIVGNINLHKTDRRSSYWQKVIYDRKVARLLEPKYTYYYLRTTCP